MSHLHFCRLALDILSRIAPKFFVYYAGAPQHDDVIDEKCVPVKGNTAISCMINLRHGEDVVV